MKLQLSTHDLALLGNLLYHNAKNQDIAYIKATRFELCNHIRKALNEYHENHEPIELVHDVPNQTAPTKVYHN